MEICLFFSSFVFFHVTFPPHFCSTHSRNKVFPHFSKIKFVAPRENFREVSPQFLHNFITGDLRKFSRFRGDFFIWSGNEIQFKIYFNTPLQQISAKVTPSQIPRFIRIYIICPLTPYKRSNNHLLAKILKSNKLCPRSAKMAKREALHFPLGGTPPRYNYQRTADLIISL